MVSTRPGRNAAPKRREDPRPKTIKTLLAGERRRERERGLCECNEDDGERESARVCVCACEGGKGNSQFVSVQSAPVAAPADGDGRIAGGSALEADVVTPLHGLVPVRLVETRWHCETRIGGASFDAEWTTLQLSAWCLRALSHRTSTSVRMPFFCCGHEATVNAKRWCDEMYTARHCRELCLEGGTMRSVLLRGHRALSPRVIYWLPFPHRNALLFCWEEGTKENLKI